MDSFDGHSLRVGGPSPICARKSTITTDVDALEERGRRVVVELSALQGNLGVAPQRRRSREPLERRYGLLGSKGMQQTAPRSLQNLLGRVALLATGAFLFGVGQRLFQATSVSNLALVVHFTLYLAAFAFFSATFLVRHCDASRCQRIVAVALALGVVASVGYEISYANPRYGTDSIAFTHAAAEMVLRGENPYEVAGAGLGRVLERFEVPTSSITRTLEGQAVDRLVFYPALHMLAYAPFLAVGVDDLRWGTLVFELAALALIWVNLSGYARLLAPFVLLLEPNLATFFTSGGVTDWLWVAPLVLCAISLRRGRMGLAAVLLGLACAAKQQPWFAVPFVLVWVGYRKDLEYGARDAGLEPVRAMAAFASWTVGTFVLVNLPFLVVSPGDWFEAVLGPALQPLLPDGQGLTLLAWRGVLNIPRSSFTILSLLVAGGLVLVYTLFIDRLAPTLWVLPGIALFAAYRSFHSYFIYWLPVALLWIDTRRYDRLEVVKEGHPARRRAFLAGGTIAIALVVGGIGGALMGKQSIEVVDSRAAIEQGIVSHLEVTVRNDSTRELPLVFEVMWGGSPFRWIPTDGSSVPGRSTRTFVLVPESSDGVPPVLYANDGRPYSRPFRVRVNPSGEAQFVVGEVITDGSES